MIKNNWTFSLLLFIVASFICSTNYALPYNVIPKAGTVLPTQLIVGYTATAFYTVTNNTKRSLPNSYVKYLPPNVTQVTADAAYPDICGQTFTLGPGASCTLELTVSGGVNSLDPNPHHHLFVCSPNVPACAGTNYPLNVQGLIPTISGRVQSGGSVSVMPIVNALVTIYGVTQNSAVPIGTATTNSNGNFYIYIPPVSLAANPYIIYYATAQKDNNMELATIIGETISPGIIINEMTTVGAAYSMAQFFHHDQIYGKSLGLKIAASMNANLVSPVLGNLSRVISSSPNANETNTMRSLGTLSNLIAPCVQNSPGACAALFAATTVSSVVPTNTLQSLLSVAHNPVNNVALIYALANPLNIYQPNLSPLQIPDAWTLAVKFNNTGSDSCPFGGPAKTVFDSHGNAWITNNVIQGTPNSTNCIVALKPNGQPADGVNNTPISPVFGGGLLGTAFGITVDTRGSIWTGNFGWGSCSGCLPAIGSVSQFSPFGIPISGSSGYTSFIYRAQGVISDQNNNIWIASYGNSNIVVFPNGDPNAAFFYSEPDSSGPFDIAIAKDGSAWVSNTLSSRVTKYAISNGQLIQQFDRSLGVSPKGIAIDSQGNAWIASTNNSTVYEVSPDGNTINSYTGGGVSGPWGITVDGNDNVWVANFEPSGVPAKFSVTELCGSNTANCPSGLSTGDPISPAVGFTLPTGGSPVLLHDGTPLYGSNGPPSFNPLMRLTHAISDQAGNVWAANNWKPNPLSDFAFNPGGDGMVVFIGLAKPPQ